MRYAKGHKKATRQEILAAAARAFRAHGLAGISISDLMKELGLTHGGFYAHFKSKDALIAEMMKQAGGSASAARLAQAASSALPSQELAGVIRQYLSSDHRDHPDIGCLLPALAGEVARQERPVRKAFTRAFTGMLAWMSGVRAGQEREEFDESLIPLLATMVGAISLARAVDDAQLSERILTLCRDHLLAQVAREEQ